MFLASFSGCIASEDGDNEGRYIDEEEDLIDYIEEEFAEILMETVFQIAH